MSSRGIRIETDDPPASGSRIDIFIDWPAPLNGETPMQLILEAYVVRVDQTSFAAEFYSTRFRTRGVQTLPFCAVAIDRLPVAVVPGVREGTSGLEPGAVRK